MATELKTLRFKRGIFKQQLTNFEKYLQSLNKECLITEDFTNLKKRLEKVELIFDPFEQFQNDIELLTFENEDEYTRECNERESFENSFYLLTKESKAKAETKEEKNVAENLTMELVGNSVENENIDSLEVESNDDSTDTIDESQNVEEEEEIKSLDEGADREIVNWVDETSELASDDILEFSFPEFNAYLDQNYENEMNILQESLKNSETIGPELEIIDCSFNTTEETTEHRKFGKRITILSDIVIIPGGTPHENVEKMTIHETKNEERVAKENQNEKTRTQQKKIEVLIHEIEETTPQEKNIEENGTQEKEIEEKATLKIEIENIGVQEKGRDETEIKKSKLKKYKLNKYQLRLKRTEKF
ncbi:hypothetical protein RN001_006106 [Aquatica leii]|uniref:Uncharacterized protein n=1 Tax=Aquatica leii TaxID=1421715 RepID=A0AAN7Q287_9COLE|nr:hypothetical protein RN001_006106 [Aquatica leii]